MTLLERVKQLCDMRGETLASLERKMDFGNGTIRRWDTTTPSGDKLVKVADFFNVSVDYLIGRSAIRVDETVLDKANSIEPFVLTLTGNIHDAEIIQKMIDDNMPDAAVKYFESLNSFSYAMQNESANLTDDDRKLLLSMAKQLREARKQKGDQ